MDGSVSIRRFSDLGFRDFSLEPGSQIIFLDIRIAYVFATLLIYGIYMFDTKKYLVADRDVSEDADGN
jgi:hypothetical protein